MKELVYFLLMTIVFVRLNNGLAASDAVQPQALAGGRVQTPENWRRCKLDSECMGVDYGCGGLAAVHRDFEIQAAEKAFKEGGDPSAISCPLVSSGEGPIEFLCRSNRCGAFRYPVCLDTACKHKFPECMTSSKHYLDPSKRDSFLSLGKVMWGPTRKDCRERCDRYVEFLRSRINDTAGQYEIDCRFDKTSLHQYKVKGSALGRRF